MKEGTTVLNVSIIIIVYIYQIIICFPFPSFNFKWIITVDQSRLYEEALGDKGWCDSGFSTGCADRGKKG